MKETTLIMLQENGMAFAAQEKENNKVGGTAVALGNALARARPRVPFPDYHGGSHIYTCSNNWRGYDGLPYNM